MLQMNNILNSWCPLMSQSYLSKRTICSNYKGTAALTDGFVLASERYSYSMELLKLTSKTQLR